MFYLLGDLFQSLFAPYKVPYLGFILNWVFFFSGIMLLAYWSKNLFFFGDDKDEPYSGI